MASEFPHIEAKDGDVWVDGVSYTPDEALKIVDALSLATWRARRYRCDASQIIRSAAIAHGRELPAHDSGRDERPVEENE